ncbi:MAG: hypothetical protein AUJ88_02690 [Gallionellaceae bacterium CG1_02_56_997]|nr:MAG: hypothetical protein AUJ88_02690 [Gallionellaceae bacterium CG1_02_56_997]
MSEKIIFIRTSSGEDEVRNRTEHLSKDIKRALLMVDGTATVAEILKRSSPSLRAMLKDMFAELASGGFIRDKSKPVSVVKQAVVSPISKNTSVDDELDFTAAYRVPTPEILAAEGRKEAEAKRAAETRKQLVTAEKMRLKEETGKFKAMQAAEIVRMKSEQERAKAESDARVAVVAGEKASLEAEVRKLKIQAETEAHRRAEAEEKAQIEAEAARQAKSAADRLANEVAARIRTEQEAARAAMLAKEEAKKRQAREEAEAVRHAEMEVHQAAEQRARLEEEVAALKAHVEAEAHARLEAEKQARLEIEAARVKAEREAASAKQQAETRAREEMEKRVQEVEAAARIKAEQQLAQARAEAEAIAAVAEQAKQDAEAARVKAEQEAASAKQQAETRAREEMEKRVQEVEAAARVKAEQQLAQARAEAEAIAAAAEQAKQDAEAARVKAEQEAASAKQQAETRAREEMEKRVQEVEATARVKAEQQLAQARAEAKTIAAAVEQAKRDAEAARIKAEQEAEEAARMRAEQQAVQVKVEAGARIAEEEKAKLAVEVAELKAQAIAAEQAKRDADAARIKAESEARALAEAKVLADVEAEKTRTQQSGDAERRKIERASVRVREASERAKRVAEARAQEKAKAETKAKGQAEAKAKATSETELKAKSEVPQGGAVHVAPGEESAGRTNDYLLAAVVRLNAKHAAMEESVFAALDDLAQHQDAAEYFEAMQSGDGDVAGNFASDAAEAKTNAPVPERRTTIAAVAFFDVVNYSTESNSKQIELKHQLNELLANSLESLGAGERVILDTGDGAAIGFLQHPTDALEAVMHFRNRLMANKFYNYPDLRVRIGIHLGPVSLVKDINGQVNMLGDGINSAQRVMSFASKNQVYVSRTYFDFVFSLSNEYNELFRYRGSQQDKHGREFQVYELLDADGPVDEFEQMPDQPEASVNLAPFKLDVFDAALLPLAQPEKTSPKRAEPRTEQTGEEPSETDIADRLLRDIARLGSMQSVQSEAKPFRQEDANSTAAGRTKTDSTGGAVSLETDKPTPQFSEEEAQALADVQAKAWADAQRRAQKIAENAALKVAQMPAKEVQAAKEIKRHVRRKPIPWGKLAAGMSALLLFALLVVPPMLPTENYRVGMEQWLGKKLQQPVHIGKLSGGILPTPHLLLREVSIGQAKQIQSKQARLNMTFAALFSAHRPISRLALDGVEVNGAALQLVTDWLQQVADDTQYPVARIALTNGVLVAEGVKLSDIEGELVFDQAGKFSSAQLANQGRKIALEIHQDAEKKLKLSVALRDTALPLLSNWVFDDMKASGELTRDAVHFTDLDGRIRGGVLTGDVRLSWLSGWHAQGALVAKVIPTQNISKLMSGDMNGSAHFQMRAESLAGLTDTTVLEGLFTVSKGIISGMDIVESARLRSRENLPGGRTHFDELTGEVHYAKGRYRFSQVSINDSVMRASGSLTVSEQQLSGNVSANLAMRAGKGAVMLQVGGTTASPTLHTVR